MRNVLIAVAIATASGGCSWLFQDHLRGGYEAYDGRSEPHCSTSQGWPLLDGVFATFGAISILTAATSDEPSESAAPYIIGGIADLIVHGASAITGHVWMGECKRAYADWDSGTSGPTQSDDEELERLRAEIARDERIAAAAKRKQAMAEAKTAAATPRGFYCASSATMPTSGLCTRQKADCARARSAALVAVTDLAECVLTERASCFDAAPGDERCAPTAEGCAAQLEREAAAIAPRELNPCVERE